MENFNDYFIVDTLDGKIRAEERNIDRAKREIERLEKFKDIGFDTNYRPCSKVKIKGNEATLKEYIKSDYEMLTGNIQTEADAEKIDMAINKLDYLYSIEGTRMYFPYVMGTKLDDPFITQSINLNNFDEFEEVSIDEFVSPQRKRS